MSSVVVGVLSQLLGWKDIGLLVVNEGNSTKIIMIPFAACSMNGNWHDLCGQFPTSTCYVVLAEDLKCPKYLIIHNLKIETFFLYLLIDLNSNMKETIFY